MQKRDLWKKTKLLLPIASVASVAAIVTPIVTSCNAYQYSFNFDNTNYKSSFTDADLPEKPSSREANVTKEYLEFVNKNNLVFADDFAYSLNVMYRDVIPIMIEKSIKSYKVDAKWLFNSSFDKLIK